MRITTAKAALVLQTAASLAAASCNADNCLRAMRATQTPGRLEAAQTFCSSYTTTSVQPTDIPDYASNACKENQNGDMAFRISSACSCIATSTPTPTATVHACEEVSSSWAAQKQATATPTVAASLAYECLNSVPLQKEEAIELVDSVVPYFEWQSDAGYLANPPPGYDFPAHDIFATLAKVRDNLVADKYENEIEFQTDLYTSVIGPAHDGHFVFYPDALAKAFKWVREQPLVSISEDGNSLPVIKLYNDVISSPDTASVIKSINGIEAVKYIEDTIYGVTSNQEPDSAYNSMFFQASSNPGGGYFVKGGRVGIIYQGPNTTFTFENGTSATYENKASVIGDMTGVVDGRSFFDAFCSKEKAAAERANKKEEEEKEPVVDVTPPGYPKAVVKTQDGIVAGYFLEGEGFEDVAVITLLAFANEDPAEFQAVCQQFFAKAVAAGKTKLVIDFQQNGGGYILQGYDFFLQLFPDILPDGFSRWKENDGFLGISQAYSDASENINPFTSGDENAISRYQKWFNYRFDLNLTNDNFLTYEDKFAPHVYEDTDYTAIMRWNLSDPLTTSNETFGIGFEMSGYGTRENISQPFAAENIVMLYDGYCASTCTLASEMLRIQAGVKSIAFGGRPQEGPIQGVGGVKGAQILYFDTIQYFIKQAASLTNDEAAQKEFARYTDLPILRSKAGAANTRDQILRDNVNDGVPAQFIKELTDCRLYWTAPMLSDPREIWKAAANSAFNGGKCNSGGIAAPAKRGAAQFPRPNLPIPAIPEPVPHVRDATWKAVHKLEMVE